MGFITKYIVGPIVGTIIGRAVLVAFHAFGLYPDLWVASLIVDAPNTLQTEAIWMLSAGIGVVLICGWHFFLVGPKLARLGRNFGSDESAEVLKQKRLQDKQDQIREGVRGTSESGPVPAQDIAIVPPEEVGVVTEVVKDRSENGRSFYRNTYKIGVKNTSAKNKSIKNLQAKVWLFNPPRNLLSDDGHSKTIDLQPGDVGFFEVGYLVSRTKLAMVRGFRSMEGQEFEGHYHNAGIEIFYFDLGGEHGHLSTHLRDIPKHKPSITIQFSADDIAPVAVNISAMPDDSLGVALDIERLQY